MISHWGFTCIFLMNNNIENLFINLFATSMSYFEKCLLESFANFCQIYFFFFLLLCEILNILDIKLLSDLFSPNPWVAFSCSVFSLLCTRFLFDLMLLVFIFCVLLLVIFWCDSQKNYCQGQCQRDCSLCFVLDVIQFLVLHLSVNSFELIFVHGISKFYSFANDCLF